MKLKRYLGKKLRQHKKRVLLDSFNGDGDGSHIRFEIVEYRLPAIFRRSTRTIEFRNNGSYIYSTVYLSKHKHFQPAYPHMQRAIDAYFRKSPLESALVLGCAGCTIPRFLTHHYKNCSVTGIEYSQQFVDIARTYFIDKVMQPRFELIRDDAFSYVDQQLGQKTFDLVYTDIYVGDNIHPKVYTQEFAQQLFDLTSEGGAALINSFRIPLERIKDFAHSIQAPFGTIYIIEHYRKYFIFLLRTNDSERLAAFEKSLPKYTEINDRITR